MTCDANLIKSLEIVFLIRDDGDTEWQIAGGVKTLGNNFDSAVEDATSSSTQGDILESAWVGYSNVTLNVSGVQDQRTGVDAATGLNFADPGRLQGLAITGNRCGKFRVFNTRTSGFIEGFFHITAYSQSRDTPGIVNFDATLQSKQSVTISGQV